MLIVELQFDWYPNALKLNRDELVLEQLTRLTQATQSMQYLVCFLRSFSPLFFCLSLYVLICIFYCFNTILISFLFLPLLLLLLFIPTTLCAGSRTGTNFFFFLFFLNILEYFFPFSFSILLSLSVTKHMRRVEMHPACQLRPLRGMDEVTTVYLR